ncbi:MAG: GNAT family N-acetyltransferase [Microthrixaceae bacterium]
MTGPSGPPPLPAGYRIDALGRRELQVLADWAAAEGWNPGRGDLDVARAVDPQAFLALRDGDELVGAGSILSLGGAMGFMGLFIVREDHRGRGLGTALWHHRLHRLVDRLAPGAPIGMDGVFAMVPFYESGGFVLAHRDLRMEGTVGAVPAGPAGPRVGDVLPATAPPVDRNELVRLDERCLGAARPEFLLRWIDRPGVRATALLRDGAVVGLGVTRPCEVGHKLGPFLAPDRVGATALLADLLEPLRGGRLQWDVPEPNRVALELAADLGLAESFGCARMYRGPAPAVPVSEVFGVTSFEFG